MDEAFGYLIGAMIVLALIAAAIMAILYIGVILLGVVAVGGAILGFFVAVKNFFLVLKEAHAAVPR